MLGIKEINARLRRLGMSVEYRPHGGGLFYLVSLGWRGEGRGFIDGVGILGSAMSLEWVNDQAAERFRDYFRIHVEGGNPYYPGNGADLIINH